MQNNSIVELTIGNIMKSSNSKTEQREQLKLIRKQKLVSDQLKMYQKMCQTNLVTTAYQQAWLVPVVGAPCSYIENCEFDPIY